MCRRKRARRCHGHGPGPDGACGRYDCRGTDVPSVTAQATPHRRSPATAPHLPDRSAGWLLATLALVAVFAITFAASRHGAAVAITAADDRVVQWFAGLRSPGSPV